MADFPDFISELAQDVVGKKDKHAVTVFTLSTCQWCKKCKRYLNDKEIKYRYIDVDKINPEQKSKILEFLRENYQSRISYPFLVCDDKFVVGYNPSQYDEFMKEEN